MQRQSTRWYSQSRSQRAHICPVVRHLYHMFRSPDERFRCFRVKRCVSDGIFYQIITGSSAWLTPGAVLLANPPGPAPACDSSAARGRQDGRTDRGRREKGRSTRSSAMAGTGSGHCRTDRPNRQEEGGGPGGRYGVAELRDGWCTVVFLQTLIAQLLADL